MKTRFITYGTKDFNLQKKHILHLAKKSGFFDESFAYGPEDIDLNFYNKHKEIFEHKKGGGYWIWKVQLILQSLKDLVDGDILIYSDSGSSLNLSGGKRFQEYIEMLKSSEFSMIRFRIDYLEKYWTTKEILDYFNISSDSKIANSNQYLAGHLIMKKNKSLLDQLNSFQKLLEYDKMLITDLYDKNQIKGFIENRHDQSILSVISKKYGCIELDNEVWFKENPSNQYSYPFLAVQQRSYSIYELVKFYSQYTKHINSTIYFGDKLYSYQKPSILKRLKYKMTKD